MEPHGSYSFYHRDLAMILGFNSRFDQQWTNMIRSEKHTWTLRKGGIEQLKQQKLGLRQELFVVCNYRMADGFMVDIVMHLHLDKNEPINMA